MKRTFTGLFVICLALCLCVNVFAQSSKVTGSVTFNGTKLTTSFTGADMTSAANALQPGDDVTYTITLKNDYTDETEWWMKNSIIKGFEESKASATGGAYSYQLTYKGPNNSRTIYDSDTVGGEDSTGMSGATSALKEYFVLGTLKKGETATVTLRVKLDGETQGNTYQNTLADLNMRFAVELLPNSEVVKTGDETDIMPYVIASTVSGVLLLTIAVTRLGKSRKSRKKKGA